VAVDGVSVIVIGMVVETGIENVGMETGAV
jgi:hypothetical protein